MATITSPNTGTRANAIQTNQPVALVADTAWNWFVRTNGGAWTQFATGTTNAVWAGASSVTNRLTFDKVEIAIGSGATPDTSTTRHFDLCEGPVPCLWASDRLRNEALEEPPLRPWQEEDDDPPLGVPLAMPGANRDGMAVQVCETASAEQGGPVNLVASYSPGIFVDNVGKLGVRTPFTNDVRGLGPYPAVAAFYHGGLYFQHDFGKSRNLGLTRVLYQNGNDIAVVRGDGRRNTYRYDSGLFSYVAAVNVANSLVAIIPDYHETTPSGRVYVYSSAGQLQKVIDRCGSTAYFAYDANSRLQKIQPVTGSGALGLVPYLSYDGSGLLSRLVLEDPSAATNNRTTYFQYDGNRNLTRIIGPESCITYFEYNNPLYLSAVTDPQGYRWYFAYDGNNRVTRAIDALGKTAYFAWNTSTPLATLKDRVGKATYFRYNAFGAPDRVFNVGTPADYYTYDGTGYLAGAKNRVGNEWTYQFDSRLNRISSTDPLGAKSYFAYDSQNLLRRYIDPVNRVTYLEYDGTRNRTKWIDPLGNTAYYEYESTGLLRQKKDRRGAFTYFAWDAKANVSKTNDPLANTTYFAYNSANEQTAAVDPLGRITYMEYDKRGRLTKTVNPVGAANYFAYDSRCNLIQETDPLIRTTDHTYDGNSNRTLTRLPATADGIRNPTYFTYDQEERLASRKNARLFATTWTYDLLGRRQKETNALAGVTYFAYTAAHQLERQQDPRLNTTYFRYDNAGRGTHQKDALLNETYFGFNGASEQVLIKDARGNHTYFQYDPRGWQRQTKNAIDAVTYFVFDEEGNRTVAIDARSYPTYFTYDLAGRLTHTKNAELSTAYIGYDKASQSVLQLDELGYPTYMEYDRAGRLQVTKDRANLRTYYTYNLASNQTAVTVDYGTIVTTYMAYDALNRQTTLTDPYNSTVTSVYDRNGNLVTAVNTRAFAAYYTFDALDRQTHVKDSVHFASTYLGYDAAGNVIRQVDQQGATSYFTFDRLNRVSFNHSPAGLLTYYVFDAVGNRTEQQVLLGAGGSRRSTYFQYDAVNRLSRQIAPDTGQTYFGLDAVGNQVMILDPMGRGSYFEYDPMNRVNIVRNGLGEKSLTTYDLRSLRTSVTDNATGRAAYFFYDAAARLASQGNGLGEYSYFFYDARGNRTQVMTPTQKAIYFTYDRLGRQTHKTSQFTDSPIFGIAYLGYDQEGNQVVAVDENGSPNYFTYDGLNRLSKQKDGAFNSTYFGYDNRSSTVLRLDPDGRATYMGYDTARRLSRQFFKNPVAGESTDSPTYYVYNQASDLTTVDDRLSGLNVTYMDYDSVDRVTKKVTLAGAVYYAYDLSGKLTSLKDPRLVETQHVYDAAGRPLASQTSAGRTAYYSYDGGGYLSLKTLPGADVKAYYAYDIAGRVKALRNLNSSNAVLTYFKFNRNANGSVTQIEHGKNDYTYFTYGNLEDPLTEIRVKNAVQVYGISWDWDRGGRRLYQYGPVDNVDPVYDARNLVTEEDSALEGYVFYEYDLAQRLKTRYSASQATYFKHDQRNQIKQIRFQGVAGDTHYFHYNGLGERVVMIGGIGGTTPTYLAYNGPLLTERDASGTTYGAYRWGPQGDLIESYDIESGVTAGPAVDQRGSVNALPGAAGGLLYDLFGEYLSETLASGARTRFLPPGQLRLDTPVQMNLLPQGLYLVRQGVLTVGASQGWQHALQLGVAPPLRALLVQLPVEAVLPAGIWTGGIFFEGPLPPWLGGLNLFGEITTLPVAPVAGPTPGPAPGPAPTPGPGIGPILVRAGALAWLAIETGRRIHWCCCAWSLVDVSQFLPTADPAKSIAFVFQRVYLKSVLGFWGKCRPAGSTHQFEPRLATLFRDKTTNALVAEWTDRLANPFNRVRLNAANLSMMPFQLQLLGGGGHLVGCRPYTYCLTGELPPELVGTQTRTQHLPPSLEGD